MNLDFLEGVRVIESSAFIAAPLAGLTLAQFGAEVIRLDMIGGGIDHERMPRMPGGASLYWTGLNKQKRSVALDLRKPAGRDLVRKLVCAPGPDAGILLTNIGVPWLSHGLLAEGRPDVITCTIEGNADGSTAVDYTVNCATGYPHATGDGREPVNSPLPTWDACCGYQAAMAVVSAVLRRRQTGQGAELRLALSDVAFSLMSHLGTLAQAELLGEDREPLGNHLYGAFGKDFLTSDGSRVMVAAISKGQWKSLVRACGLAEAMADIEARTGANLADEAQRFAHREAIAAACEPWFRARTLAQVRTALDEGGVCWGLYQTATQMLARDGRVGSANPLFERIATAGAGEHWTVGTPVREPRATRRPTQGASLLGQHTDQVLGDVLGLSARQISDLHAAGVVAGPSGDPRVAP